VAAGDTPNSRLGVAVSAGAATGIGDELAAGGATAPEKSAPETSAAETPADCPWTLASAEVAVPVGGEIPTRTCTVGCAGAVGPATEV
jgi:hypothetical protein